MAGKTRKAGMRTRGTRKAPRAVVGVSKTGVAKLTVPVKRAVNRIIHAGEERKYVANPPIPTTAAGPNNVYPPDELFNAVTNSSVMEMFTAVPYTVASASAGGGSSSRLGQRLTPKRIYSDFAISINPAATSSKDIIVKLWILTSKELKNYDDIALWGTAGNRPLPINWLDNGSGGDTVSLGNMYDLMLPVKNESWTQLKTYTFRLSKSSQLLQNNGTSYVATSTPCVKRIRFYHKSFPKQLTYDGNLTGNQYPLNYAPVWCVSYAYADGSAPQVNNKDIKVTNWNHMEFYDA